MPAPCAKASFPRDYGTTPEPTILLRRCGEGHHTEARRQRALASGWFFDTNLSSPQVRLRLELACEVAGITFGVDLVPPKQLLGDVLTLEDLA
jgi:hypothetical protein